MEKRIEVEIEVENRNSRIIVKNFNQEYNLFLRRCKLKKKIDFKLFFGSYSQ